MNPLHFLWGLVPLAIWCAWSERDHLLGLLGLAFLAAGYAIGLARAVITWPWRRVRRRM